MLHQSKHLVNSILKGVLLHVFLHPRETMFHTKIPKTQNNITTPSSQIKIILFQKHTGHVHYIKIEDTKQKTYKNSCHNPL